MADPICRWRNSSLKQVMEFNSLFPTSPVEKSKGRDVVNRNWTLLDGSDFFTTPYQLAAQLGLYYEDDSMFYPRFGKLISLVEGADYLKYWAKRYYAPNPYTKSMQLTPKPVVINNFLVNWALDNGERALFSEALKSMFKENIGNTDILINMLNNFSEVTISNNIVSIKDKNGVDKYPDGDVWLEVDSRDKKSFFEFVGKDYVDNNDIDAVISVKDLTSEDRKKYFADYLRMFAFKGDGTHISESTQNNYKGALNTSSVCDLIKEIFPKYANYYDIISSEEIDATRMHQIYIEINSTQNNRLSAALGHYLKYLDCYVKNGTLINISESSDVIQTDLFTSVIEQKDFNVASIISSIKSTGLLYSDDLIKRFAYALMSKPFVILSGLAGSGKTQLALAFAKCLAEDVKNQVCTVSVGADWTNREPLLGYPNALKSREYVKPESGVLDLLLNASKDPNKPYFLILDEMNLSVVERYFADFLSAMESHEPIKLWTGEADVPTEIVLPKNVYIIGTINVDETTYMFSPKVLDRANVIEFKIAEEEMVEFLSEKKTIDRAACYSACADMAHDFLKQTQTCKESEIDTNIVETLNGFFANLKCVNAEFGYRTVNEIYRYVSNVGEDLGEYGAIDTAILQKLLPKLHGSRKKIAPVLTALWALCFADKESVEKIENVKDFGEVKDKLVYKYSAEKILRMYKAVIDNGFTSFAEA